ncbi:hypothetical protein PBY51_001598 [Eleginops maclovinus]|uniref:Uncharacterized protein n=1 Tax=Eleginops maclovinus TaxID=56733 RepID=A0AAN7WXU4_ELEMC|nr:hypothetical protein PBY51_001598 [Eleginops maclovinus]
MSVLCTEERGRKLGVLFQSGRCHGNCSFTTNGDIQHTWIVKQVACVGPSVKLRHGCATRCHRSQNPPAPTNGGLPPPP